MTPNRETDETMSEGSPLPPRGALQELAAAKMGTPSPMSTPDGCVKIPLKALAQPDDKEQMQTPGEGDSVSFTVDGTIESIDGENAVVRPMNVNNTPLDENEGEPDGTNEAPANEESDLRSMALSS